jgi:hypothetical protein
MPQLPLLSILPASKAHIRRCIGATGSIDLSEMLLRRWPHKQKDRLRRLVLHLSHETLFGCLVFITSSWPSSSSGTKLQPPHVGHCCSSSVPFSMTPSPLQSGQVFMCASWRCYHGPLCRLTVACKAREGRCQPADTQTRLKTPPRRPVVRRRLRRFRWLTGAKRIVAL